MIKLLSAFVWGAALMFLVAVSLAQAQPRYRIVIMPKLVGIACCDAVKTGIDAAAKELPDVAVTWSGPTQDQVEKQIEMIERLFPTKPDLIAVAANDPVSIVPVLTKAQRAGIRVMGWDGDSKQREFFVNLVDFEDFGAQLVEAMNRELWNAPDHGYLTVYSARQLLVGGLKAGQPFQAGKLGSFTPRKDELSMQVALPVMVFTKDNVDQFKF